MNSNYRINTLPAYLTTEGADNLVTGLATEGPFQNDIENEEQLSFDTKVTCEYKLEKSSSSFKFEDLSGFVFGPVTSRFWMLRKALLCMEKGKLQEEAPFHAWECITLQVKGRPDIYLVIKNEKIMSLFIKLLIYKMRTIDGKRGSMDKMIDLIMK